MADWKFKLVKLKQLILSAVDPSEAAPMFLEWISAHQRINRGESTEEEVSREAESKFGVDADIGAMNMNFTWDLGTAQRRGR
jgi:hypothetical protein